MSPAAILHLKRILSGARLNFFAEHKRDELFQNGARQNFFEEVSAQVIEMTDLFRKVFMVIRLIVVYFELFSVLKDLPNKDIKSVLLSDTLEKVYAYEKLAMGLVVYLAIAKTIYNRCFRANPEPQVDRAAEADMQMALELR